MGMHELAKHILAVANENELGVTNLQLQKVMYFVVRSYLVNHEDFRSDPFIHELYNDKFETWPYGPVVPDIYYLYNSYGSLEIFNEGSYDDEYKIFDSVIINFLKMDVFKLVRATQTQPLWQEHRHEILNHINTYEYGLEDIIEHG
ncbi:Panacea domain-containing protein [Xylocopilactobacillus apicola]|uniref:Antitoxin SocA-like Panacea domain-containing protein n=1 Tax=Xylocopilactobacillus apicola TaxID=2932184 RepID=A0AAU9D5F7_9LACO|nr:type II toxin-antitoxin system antitoxin SocA domain-containing protein [Xylocopilactobacillus apicola]BDR57701.1 hypothetical protein XA3_01420 [Xylocopilactobacillus apicola]